MWIPWSCSGNDATAYILFLGLRGVEKGLFIDSTVSLVVWSLPCSSGMVRRVINKQAVRYP